MIKSFWHHIMYMHIYVFYSTVTIHVITTTLCCITVIISVVTLTSIIGIVFNNCVTRAIVTVFNIIFTVIGIIINTILSWYYH